MGVPSANQIDVQIAPQACRERTPEVFGHLDRKVSDLLTFGPHLVGQVEAPGQIDRGSAQRLIHRNDRRAVSIDAGLVSQGFRESLAETYRYVFDRVMIVHV